VLQTAACAFLSMVVDWAQILPRQGVSGGKHPTNHEIKGIFSKESTFFSFKTSSYGHYESIYKTNLILPLPLSMWELKKNETPNFCR
jgi:hypothetical protein